MGRVVFPFFCVKIEEGWNMSKKILMTILIFIVIMFVFALLSLIGGNYKSKK